MDEQPGETAIYNHVTDSIILPCRVCGSIKQHFLGYSEKSNLIWLQCGNCNSVFVMYFKNNIPKIKQDKKEKGGKFYG